MNRPLLVMTYKDALDRTVATTFLHEVILCHLGSQRSDPQRC